MSNKINDLIYRLHNGLSVAENQGDVRDRLPYLIELEALIARIKEEPELLQGFDAEGIAKRYAAEGYIWCSCYEEWRHRDDLVCCALDEEDGEG